MAAYSEENLLLLSGIQHFAFCKRQWALIHIEQQWQENLLTYSGREMHERADDPFFNESRGAVLIARAMPLVSWELGLYGVADVVEFHQNDTGIKITGKAGLWVPLPVEYKLGQPKSDDRDMVQLCAQALCLEDMLGVRIATGDIYYGRIRRRQQVCFDSVLRERVIALTKEMHELYALGFTPQAQYSLACKNCSLMNICLPAPKSKKSVRRYLTDALRD